MKTLLVYLDDDVHKELKGYSKKSRYSMNLIIERLIMMFLAGKITKLFDLDTYLQCKEYIKFMNKDFSKEVTK